MIQESSHRSNPSAGENFQWYPTRKLQYLEPEK